MLTELFINWQADPVLFHLGPLDIRWYSLLFVSGFFIGWYIFKWFFKREGVDCDLLDPLLFTLLLGTIIGARLGHCLFYDPQYYFGTWTGFREVFMPWKGGLASHGGAIMLILCMWWYAKRYGTEHGFDFVWILDHLAIAVAFAACLIRVGNLFNSEIYGYETSLPWGIIFSLRGEEVPKHPAQMYEAITYLLLGIFLILLYKYRLNKTYRGTYVGIFLIICFGVRFLIEYVKDSKMIFEGTAAAMKMGQFLSIPFILLGMGFLIYAYVRKKPAGIVEEPQERRKPKEDNFANNVRSLG